MPGRQHPFDSRLRVVRERRSFAQTASGCRVSWLYLFLAIGLEVFGTTCMKLSQGFSKAAPSVLLFVFYGLSVVSLTLAVKRLDISVAYAVWSGLGTGLMAFIGVAWFDEPLTTLKAVALGLIIVGVVGVNLAD